MILHNNGPLLVDHASRPYTGLQNHCLYVCQKQKKGRMELVSFDY
jgi:hypothetical protein